MSRLPYLVREAGVALDIYLAGRSSGAFHRAAFILADDCAELAGKLFLSAQPGWTDAKASGGFKGFVTITQEVRALVASTRPADAPTVAALTAALESRRERRNGFFHSAHLLDLTLHARDCVEALTDMLDYGAVLFPANPALPGSGWAGQVPSAGAMETAEALLRLDRRAYAEPALLPQVTEILARERRIGKQRTRVRGGSPSLPRLPLGIASGKPSLPLCPEAPLEVALLVSLQLLLERNCSDKILSELTLTPGRVGR